MELDEVELISSSNDDNSLVWTELTEISENPLSPSDPSSFDGSSILSASSSSRFMLTSISESSCNAALVIKPENEWLG